MYDNIDSTKEVLNLVKKFRYGALVGDISLEGYSKTAGQSYPLNNRFGLLAVSKVVNGNSHSVGTKTLGYRASDTPDSAGHDSNSLFLL